MAIRLNGLNSGGWNSLSIKNLFSGLNTTGFNSMSSMVSDYNLIRSGSYGKLLGAYYDKMNKESSSVSTSTQKSSGYQGVQNRADRYAVTEEEKQARAKQKTSKSTSSSGSVSKESKVTQNSKALQSAADALIKHGSDSVFNKVSSKDENGKTTESYDRKKIGQALFDFAESYNKFQASAKTSVSSGVTTAAENVRKQTSSNEAVLSSIGLSVDESGKMSLDQEKFNKADLNLAKNLFQKVGGYGYQVSGQAYLASYYGSASNQNTGYNATGIINNISAANLYDMYS